MPEGGVRGSDIRGHEILIEILPRIRFVSNTMEISHPLLSMEQVEEPGILLSRVSLQVKKEMNLMGSRRFPFPEEVEHVQGRQPLNTVRSNLEGRYAEVIGHP